ncbi:hypothetical protein AB6A40_002250 [Gnathostoma spinigerum]|uniref:Uncharacterized protein n=1 Tax=Gnathostoma spinigerum TaxID=75299 RepID=A0ABD6E8M4_9BILA
MSGFIRPYGSRYVNISRLNANESDNDVIVIRYVPASIDKGRSGEEASKFLETVSENKVAEVNIHIKATNEEIVKDEKREPTLGPQIGV